MGGFLRVEYIFGAFPKAGAQNACYFVSPAQNHIATFLASLGTPNLSYRWTGRLSSVFFVKGRSPAALWHGCSCGEFGVCVGPWWHYSVGARMALHPSETVAPRGRTPAAECTFLMSLDIIKKTR